MTSSSSLYGTVTTQSTNSGNSTSLYGEAGTPIPDSGGNVVVRGDLIVLSGNILTTASTGNIFPTNATTINLGLAATTVNIGAATGTTTINNNLTVSGDITADGADFGNIQIAVTDNNTIDTTSGGLKLSSTTGEVGLVGADTLYTDQSNFLLLNFPTTVTAFDSATSLTMGDVTGTTTIRNALTVLDDITASGADLGNITIAVTDDQTITTTTGELRLSSTNGNIKLAGINTVYSDELTFNLLNNSTTVYAFRNATTLELGEDTGTTTINNNLDIEGNRVGLAPATSIVYDENNDRLNRPAVRSTTGNSSGFRVEAPNATANAISTISAFNSNDNDNGKFININARGSTFSNDLRIQTGKYTAGVLGDSGSVVSFIDNATLYATVNPAGPTDALDLTTKAYVDAQVDSNTTYTVDASATTGGANFNLVGSDATTDTVKFAGGTNVSVTATDANTITIAATDTNTTYTQDVSSTTGGANLNLVGSDSTTDSVKFAGGTNVTVVATDASTMTINATDTNTTYDFNATSTTGGANLNLVGSDSTTDTVKISNGTGVTVSQLSGTEVSVAIGQPVGTTDDVIFDTIDANITDDNYVLGQLIATRNTAYVPPVNPLTTIAGQNGLVIASSSGGLGYGANIAIRYHSGDTSAGLNNAAQVVFSGVTGTNSTPGGSSTNQVLGTLNYDGYTAGTSNNYASTIATTNQGGGTAALTPLQAQAYARQAFTNSTTVTTAVTGASGTGSVATLTFTTQNTAPYAVGQSITVAGMTPSGYNGTYTITAATTSSISYANTTTGFTSGGTIAAANTVTAAGMGFRVRGFANSTAMTAGNRFNFMDLTASAATFKSNSYTFANEVITGSTLTATNYLTLGSTGSTFTSPGINNFIRTGNTASQPSAILIRYSRTDQTGAVDGDGVDFRLSVGGTSTTANFARFDGIYRASGDNEIGMSVSADSFTADTDRVYVGSRASTKIRTTPAGGGTTADTATFTQLATTIKSDSVVLQNAAGMASVGNNISYNRVYGQWQNLTTITPAAANTAYAFALPTVDYNNVATVASTSQITPGALGFYKMQFSVQVLNTDNAAEHTAYFWWRKNGVDIPGSMGRLTVPRGAVGGELIAGWDNMVQVTSLTDYWELMYAVDDVALTFPFYASTAFGPSTASLFVTLVPIGA